MCTVCVCEGGGSREGVSEKERERVFNFTTQYMELSLPIVSKDTNSHRKFECA